MMRIFVVSPELSVVFEKSFITQTTLKTFWLMMTQDNVTIKLVSVKRVMLCFVDLIWSIRTYEV